MKNGYERVLLLFLAAGLLLCTMMAFLFPAPRLSERENRYLAPVPTFSFSSLADGSFETAADLYLTERFPWRNAFREIRAVSELAIGKMEVGRVILGKDMSLIKRLETDERIFTGNLRGLVALDEAATEAGVPVTIAIPPRSMDVRRHVLPAAFRADSTPYETLCRLFPDVVDLRGISEDSDWYRTDHHWTTAGAYQGYLALCPTLGIHPFAEDAFTKTSVSTTFYGTTDAAAGIPGISPDTVTLYRYPDDTDFAVRCNGEIVPFTGFYDFSKLETRDKYGVFLGGNYATVEITRGTAESVTSAVKTRQTLLVYKDSFANALIPFLARHFDILAVDPRYAKEPLASFLGKADAVLILCGMQSMGETRMFQKI